MKGIPPEIDQLLWAVAENPSLQAGDEFVQRYPHYAGELARRRTMVQGLKGGRTTATPAPRPTPTFHPAPKVAPPPSTLYAVGGLVLVAVGALSSTLSTALLPRPAKEPAPIHSVPLGPVESGQDAVVRGPSQGPSAVDRRFYGKIVPKPTPTRPILPVPTPEPTFKNDGAPNGIPTQTFHVKGAKLLDALTMLGAQARVKIVVAPGLKDQVIDADYESMQLNAILLDLGRKYTFTPFDQGDGSVIVVPAVDGLSARLSSKSRAPSGIR